MSEKEKKKQVHEKLDYAQEDWYKSNRTPENLKQYELGQELTHDASSDVAHNNNNKHAVNRKNDANELEMRKKRFSEELDNFEFGQDNYFGANGTLNNNTGKVQMSQQDFESMDRLSNMAEHNHYPSRVDMEFASDYLGFDEQATSKKNKKD